MERKNRLIHCLPPEDGIIATLLNSKVSLLIVKWLSKTKVNSNQVTVLAFLIVLIAVLLFFTGRYLSIE